MANSTRSRNSKICFGADEPHVERSPFLHKSKRKCCMVGEQALNEVKADTDCVLCSSLSKKPFGSRSRPLKLL